jgi:predicted DNA-binding transcriptional regulator AlpA
MSPKKSPSRMRAKRAPRDEPKKVDKRHRTAPIAGTVVVWPKGVEARYGISDITRWRWEKQKKLPPRDMFIGGRTGWKPETLAEYDRATQVAVASA